MTQPFVVQEFDNPDEQLYRRFPPNRGERKYFDIDANGIAFLNPIYLPLPRCSVNRQRLSAIQDVIERCVPPKEDWGIATITVDRARVCQLSISQSNYICDVKHLPDELHNNESHSEIQVFLNSSANDFVSELPKDIKKALRTQLAFNFMISRLPDY